jgi:hypothetical protein
VSDRNIPIVGGGNPIDHQTGLPTNTPHQTSAERARRLMACDPTAAITTTPAFLPDGTPAVFLSQRSRKLDLLESDVVVPLREGIMVFCQLLAASIGMQIAFAPLQMTPPPNGPTP